MTKGIGGRRWNMDKVFDAATIAEKVEEHCTICNGKIEAAPMLRGVCYECYQDIVQEKHKALQIVLDVASTPEVAPWDQIPDVSDTTPKYVPEMALHGYAYNSRRLNEENEARKELHKEYNKLFK